MPALEMADFVGTALTCVRGERLVFEGVDFRVNPGEVLLLVGPNGSGKSSLLRLMASLIRPAAGRLIWAGKAVADDPESHRARLHYVGHLDALKPVLTVAENLGFYADLRGNAGRIDAALEAFGLEPLARVPARYLSQGQRHRASLARLIAAQAPLWLLDEPTLGLDDASVARLITVIGKHVADGGAAVIATHAKLALASSQLALGRP